MTLRRLFIAVLPLMALGCVSAQRHFGNRVKRLDTWADTYIARDQRYAPRAVSEYSRFLKTLPAHPSLDGIRAHALNRRARLYRLMKREDLAVKDDGAVEKLQASSPYFRQSGESGLPAAPPPDTSEPEPAPATDKPPAPRDPSARPVPATPRRPAREPRIHADLALSVSLLSRAALQSDSRSHADQTVDFEDDLDGATATAYPEFTLEVRGRQMKSWLRFDFRSAQYTGETEIEQDLSFDGRTWVAGESVRSRIRISSFGASIRFAPSAKTAGKVELELGLRHVYLETRLSGSLTGTHIDGVHMPMLFPGLHGSFQVAKRTHLGGSLRGGGMIWSSSSFSVIALAFEARFELRFDLTDHVALHLGAKVEHLSFIEDKSGDRRKQFGIGQSGGFGEVSFKF